MVALPHCFALRTKSSMTVRKNLHALGFIEERECLKRPKPIARASESWPVSIAGRFQFCGRPGERANMANDLMHRDAVLLGDAADQKARTVPLTLSTETPVDRGGYDEILGHSPGEVDLTRAPLPMIESHDANRLPIGIIENLQLVGRKLRGTARFGNSARAKEVFNDVIDGVIRNVSIGYRYLNDGQPEGKRALRFAWQPMELSAVSVGADPNAGFMRKENTMATENYHTRGQRRAIERDREKIQFAAIPPEDRGGFRTHLDLTREAAANGGDEPDENLTREYSNFRADAIRTYAEIYPLDAGRQEINALAQLAIGDEKTTVEAFRKKVLAMIDRHQTPPTNTGALELDRLGPHHQGGMAYGDGGREIQRYGNLQAFKGADAERRAYACGQFFRSLVGDKKAGTWCTDNGIVANRTMTEGVFSAGGALVPDMVSNEIINNVEQFGIFRRHSKIWPMTSASLSVPVSNQGLTIAAVGENTATTASDLVTTQIALTAKEFAGGTKVSKSLLEDSAVALGDFLVTEFARALGQIEDQCGFTADGTSTYGGMRGIIWKLENDADYAGSKSAATTPHNLLTEIDVSDLTKLMGIVPEYARAGSAWYASATAKDVIFTRLVASGGGNNTETMRLGGGESFLGYPVRTSQVMPAGVATDYNAKCVLLFGNLALASAFGDRRTLDTVIDMSRFVEYRQVYFQVCERFDVNNHMTGTTATACGPIAGLFGTT